MCYSMLSFNQVHFEEADISNKKTFILISNAMKPSNITTK